MPGFYTGGKSEYSRTFLNIPGCSFIPQHRYSTSRTMAGISFFLTCFTPLRNPACGLVLVISNQRLRDGSEIKITGKDLCVCARAHTSCSVMSNSLQPHGLQPCSLPGSCIAGRFFTAWTTRESQKGCVGPGQYLLVLWAHSSRNSSWHSPLKVVGFHQHPLSSSRKAFWGKPKQQNKTKRNPWNYWKKVLTSPYGFCGLFYFCF